MPGSNCTRLYSEFIAQDAESDWNLNATHVGVSYNNRFRLTRLSGINAQALGRPDFEPSFKLQKTIGLNSRFDRMLERVNSTLQDPTTTRHGRARNRSTGSSSVSSGYDIPKTPVDVYSGLEEGRSGQTFPVIEMKGASGSGGYCRAGDRYDQNSDVQSEGSNQIIPVTVHKEPVPEWLSKAFLTLDPQNPLRRLLPASPETQFPLEKPIFAFSHIAHDEDPRAADKLLFEYQNSELQDRQDTYRQSHSRTTLCPVPTTNHSGPNMLQPILLHRPDNNDYFLPPNIDILTLPFSTPGPSSTISLDQFQCTSRTAIVDNSTEGDADQFWNPLSMPEPLIQPSSNGSILHAPVATRPHSSSIVFDPEAGLVPASPSPLLLYEDATTDSSDSEHLPLAIKMHKLTSVARLPQLHSKNPFSTPGPGFCVPLSRPVYFESPTEDPSDSDPLAPPEGYELDEVDFRWEPFMRKNESNASYGNERRDKWYSTMDFNTRESAEETMTIGFKVQQDTPEPTNEAEASMTHFSRSHHSPVQYPVSLTPDRRQREEPSTPEPRKDEAPFAPAPGIFISPLHNQIEPPKLQVTEVFMSLEEQIPQTYIPVTPKNKLAAPLGLSNATRIPSRKSSSCPKLNIPPQMSTPIFPLNVIHEIQTREATAKIEASMMQGVFSQVSNDSIESWSEEIEDWR